MGNSISLQSITRDINDSIKTSLQQDASADANNKCSIHIENVKIGETVNCTFTIANFCSADGKASLKASIDGLLKAINKLTNEQKAMVAAYFTTSVGIQANTTNLDNSITTYLNTKCGSKAHLDNAIDIKDLYYGVCKSTTNLNFQVINTGQASSNCVIDTVINTSVNAATDISNKQESGLNWVKLLEAFMWPILIIFLTVAISFTAITISKTHRKTMEEEVLVTSAQYNPNFAKDLKHIRDELK